MTEQSREVHIHYHEVDLSGVFQRLDEIKGLLLAVLRNENQIMTTTDELLQAATEQDTLVDSMVAAFASLQAAVKAIPGLAAEQQRQIDNTFALMSADKSKIADAMASNTAVPVGDLTATP